MKLLVFQHISCEHPRILRRFLVDDDISYDTVEFDRGETMPRLEDYDMLWVMGGPMDVWDIEDCPWLVAKKRAIRRWVRQTAAGARAEVEKISAALKEHIVLLMAASQRPLSSLLCAYQRANGSLIWEMTARGSKNSSSGQHIAG